MGLPFLIFAIVCFVLIGVGLALGLVAAALGFALVSLGIVSSSLLLGVWKKRPATAMRAFLVQCGLFAGIPAGLLCGAFAQAFFEMPAAPTITAGACAGAASGLLVALVCDTLVRWSIDSFHPASPSQNSAQT